MPETDGDPWDEARPPSSRGERVFQLFLRAVARLADLALVVLMIGYAMDLRYLLPEVSLLELGEDGLVVADLLVVLAALWIYGTVSEALGGATLGKSLTMLRTYDTRTRERPSWRDAAARNAVVCIDYLTLGLFAYPRLARNRSRLDMDGQSNTAVDWAWTLPKRTSLRGWPLATALTFAWLMGSYLITG